MERLLWKITALLIAVAAVATVPVALDYLRAEPGRACPGAQDEDWLCAEVDLGGMPHAVAFYPESFDAQGASALLAGILSASAAVLAISFALNQIVLSNISQRYSSRLVEWYTGQPTDVFTAFVLMVAASAALLLALNSLPAWLAAPAVLALTLGLFAALWLFARGFMHMMRVISPHRFLEGAKEKILAEMVGSRGQDIRVQSLREKPSQEKIRSLGDTAVKSLASNDDDICVACIEALYGVAEAFLYRKRGSPKEYEVVSEEGAGLSCNAHAISAAKEFVRILCASTGAGNSPVTRNVLEKFYKMTELAMQDEHNGEVIMHLYDTARLKGSLYLQLVERVADAGSKRDKIYMIKHLADLPYTAVKGGRRMEFVEQFVIYHTFRSIVIIIERDDFDLFKELLHLFSHNDLFGHAKNIRVMTSAEILNHCTDSASLDKILFELDNCTQMDFGTMPALKQEVEELLAQTTLDTDAALTAAGNVHMYMDRMHVCNLLWGTFFRIACYLIGKGGKYSAYLHELWNHTNPAGQPYLSVNEPPCSKDVDWNTMYSIWHGHDGSGGLEDSDNGSIYAPHYRKYAVLHMLREGRIWHVPTDDEIARWGESGAEHALHHYYQIAAAVDAGMFLEALDSLPKKLRTELLPGLDVQTQVASVRAQLERSKDGRQRLIEKLVDALPVKDEKIGLWKEVVRKAYSEHTRADAVARVKYDERLPDASLVSVQYCRSRESLVKKDGAVPDGRPGIACANAEFREILGAVGDGATCVRADADRLADSIKACVRKMRDDGRNPSVALVSLDHGLRIPEMHAAGKINAGDLTVPIMRAPIFLPRRTTLVLDPGCVEVTYGTKDEAGRIRMEVRGTETRQATMDVSIPMSVKILDRAGVAKITSDDA